MSDKDILSKNSKYLVQLRNWVFLLLCDLQAQVLLYGMEACVIELEREADAIICHLEELDICIICNPLNCYTITSVLKN